MARELSRISPDKPGTHDLTTAQCRAVAALAGGATIVNAAAAAGVSRPTVYAWFQNNAEFTAELNRARAEQREAIRTELRGLATAAVGTVRELIESPETPPAVRLRASLAVLQAVGAEPIGPTDPADIECANQARDFARLFGSTP
jgi:AcrR family transcriptional regulator